MPGKRWGNKERNLRTQSGSAAKRLQSSLINKGGGLDNKKWPHGLPKKVGSHNNENKGSSRSTTEAVARKVGRRDNTPSLSMKGQSAALPGTGTSARGTSKEGSSCGHWFQHKSSKFKRGGRGRGNFTAAKEWWRKPQVGERKSQESVAP